MINKKHEERYYKQLEKTFKEMKQQEKQASKQIAVQQLQRQMQSSKASSDKSLGVDNAEVALKEAQPDRPLLEPSHLAPELNLPRVETEPVQAHVVDPLSHPGVEASLEMHESIKRLSRRIREQSRKKSQMVIINNSFYDAPSRNKEQFDFPTLVSQVKKKEETSVDSRSDVLLPSLTQNPSVNRFNVKLEPGQEKLSYKDFIGYMGGTDKDSYYGQRLQRQRRKRHHGQSSKSISQGATQTSTLVHPVKETRASLHISQRNRNLLLILGCYKDQLCISFA